MPISAYVEAGLSLSTPAGQPTVVVGFLAEDQVQRVYGVSLRDAAGPQGVATANTDGQRLGGPLRGPAYQEGVSPITDAAWRFAVADNVFVDPGCKGMFRFVVPTDCRSLLGARVFKLDDRGPQSARITRLYASLTLTGGDLPPSRLTGAIEVTPDDPATFATEGDGGAPIITMDHRVAGLLLSGDGDRYFAIPAADWLAANGLGLLGEEAANRHNTAVSARFFDADGIENRLADLTRRWTVEEPFDLDAVGELAAAFAVEIAEPSALYSALLKL